MCRRVSVVVMLISLKMVMQVVVSRVVHGINGKVVGIETGRDLVREGLVIDQSVGNRSLRRAVIAPASRADGNVFDIVALKQAIDREIKCYVLLPKV